MKGRDVVCMVLGGLYGRVNVNVNLSYVVFMSGFGGVVIELLLVMRLFVEILCDLNK